MGHIGRVPGGLFLRYLMVLEFGVMPCAVFESSKQAHGFWATNDPLFRSTLSFQSSLPMIADGGSWSATSSSRKWGAPLLDCSGSWVASHLPVYRLMGVSSKHLYLVWSKFPFQSYQGGKTVQIGRWELKYVSIQDDWPLILSVLIWLKLSFQFAAILFEKHRAFLRKRASSSQWQINSATWRFRSYSSILKLWKREAGPGEFGLDIWTLYEAVSSIHTRPCAICLGVSMTGTSAGFGPWCWSLRLVLFHCSQSCWFRPRTQVWWEFLDRFLVTAHIYNWRMAPLSCSEVTSFSNSLSAEGWPWGTIG